ncbi:UNVERIFIED_CONTAM: hypothetical protein FKN15_016830 [Acipenser sinensis]
MPLRRTDLFRPVEGAVVRGLDPDNSNQNHCFTNTGKGQQPINIRMSVMAVTRREGEERSAAGGVLPITVAGQGTASGSIRGKRKAQARLPTCARKCTRTGLLTGVPGGAKEGPQSQSDRIGVPPSAGNEGPGPRAAAEGGKDPSPEAVQGSSETAEPREEAPAERPKGREEPARAEIALRADPLPVSKETPDNAEPMQETPDEGREGEKEPPLPEQELPRAPEAGVGSADNAEPMQAAPAERPEGGKVPSQEQEPPRASEASRAGEKAAEWTVVALRKKKVAARSTGEAKRGETKPIAAPSGGGSGGVPDKGTPSTAPPARQGGKAARKTKHLTPGGEERSAAGGELPVAVTRQGTASSSLRGKRKAQARLPTCARKCTRTGLMVGVPGGAKEGPPKPKRPPRRPPSAGNEGPGPRNATERVKDPSPEAVRGSAEEAVEPMEEAPAERPKVRAEPVRAEEALWVDPLPVIQQTSEASPETEGPAAAEVAEGAQEGPPKEQLPRAPPFSDGDTGPETCVAEGGAAEPAPEAGMGSVDKAEPMQATPAEGPEGEEEQPLPEQEMPRAPVSVEETDSAPEASVGSADNAEPMQATLAEGSEGGEEPPQEQDLPQASLSHGNGGFGLRAAAEGDEETPPEAEAGSAEPALTLVSGARKGGEEPEREGGALEVDPLPEVQRGQIPVTEGAREEPLKEQPPRASISGGDEGSGPRAAVGRETSTEAVPVTDAEEGEGPEKVYPLSLGEGGEGPERVDPLPSRKEDGPETVPRTSKEGPRAGTTRPSGSAAYVERPSAPPKSRVQTVPARVPLPISPAASRGGGALGESVKIKIRRNALTQQRECVELLHREGGGGEPEEREEDSESACSVGSERLSAPSPDIPAADLLEFLEATVHFRDEVQLALDKWGDFQRTLTSVRSFLRASHANKTSGSNVHIRARKLHDHYFLVRDVIHLTTPSQTVTSR